MSYARDPLILYIPSSFCVKCWYYFRGGKKENIPVYISIDKDVLRVEDARCNWSQGNMSKEELLEMVSEIYRTRRVLGMDICGEEDRKDLTEGTRQNEKRNQELAELPRGCHSTAKIENT